MSEFGGYTPPEAWQKKPENEGKEWKEHAAFDRAAARWRTVSSHSSEQSARSPESLSSGDVNKPRHQQGVGDHSRQQNDATSGKGQNDSHSGNQQQQADQTGTATAKIGDDVVKRQNDADTEKLRQVRAELEQIQRGHRHDLFRR